MSDCKMPQIASPSRDALGEGPFWHPQENVLYWVDIAAARLHRLDPSNQQSQSWPMPAPIGCIAARKKGGLIAAIGDEICFIDLPSGKITPQKKAPGGLRLNDGKCDRQGRFWVGSADPIHPNAFLYRYDPDGSLHTMADGIYISNGLGWSSDNKIFYYADSLAYKIVAYDFDAVTGTISHRRDFAFWPKNAGVFDGLTVDSENHIWAAIWDGGKIIRYNPRGEIVTEIKMPVQRPTSCAFGGKEFNKLFVTSCSRDLNETETLPAPAGAVFVLNVGATGIIEPEFLG